MLLLLACSFVLWPLHWAGAQTGEAPLANNASVSSFCCGGEKSPKSDIFLQKFCSHQFSQTMDIEIQFRARARGPWEKVARASRGSAGAEPDTSAPSVIACPSARQPIPHNPRLRPPLPPEVGCTERERFSITVSGSRVAGGGVLMSIFFFSSLKSGCRQSRGSEGAE